MPTVRRRPGRATYTYRVRFPSGEWKEFGSGVRDKRAAEQIAADHQRRIDRGEVGLIDPFEATKRVKLTDLVDTYTKALASEGRAERYVRSVKDQLALVIEVTGASFVQDLALQRVETFLTKLLAGDGMPLSKKLNRKGVPIPRRAVTVTTRDRYVATLRAFGAWLLATERWGSNPFGKLRLIAGDDARTMEHRAYTPDEVSSLLEAATTRCTQEWARTHAGSERSTLDAKLAELEAEGWRRSVLYEFAAYTGLRLNECTTLTWGDVVLDGDEPCVTVQARRAKNRKRGQAVPLVPWVAAALRELWKRNQADRVRARLPMLGREDLVFTIGRNVLAHLRRDAKWAELGDYDAQGRRTTFHGFRASTCTMLHRAGVSLAVAVRIMRHADPKLTIDTYAKLDTLTDGHRELAKMATPRVTAVPVSTPASTCAVPVQSAVGCSSQSAESGSAIARRVEAAEAARVAQGESLPVGSSQDDAEAGELVGRAGFEPATKPHLSAATTSRQPPDGGRVHTGVHTNRGEGEDDGGDADPIPLVAGAAAEPLRRPDRLLEAARFVARCLRIAGKPAPLPADLVAELQELLGGRS